MLTLLHDLLIPTAVSSSSVVAGVVGGLVALLVVLVVGYLVWRKRWRGAGRWQMDIPLIFTKLC